MKLIQPQTLADENSGGIKKGGLLLHVSQEGKHATAALPDFHRSGEGWRWNRRPGASFRILQYDGYMCPDIDLPFATDDVVREPEVRPPSSPARSSTLSPIAATATTKSHQRKDGSRGPSIAIGAGGSVTPKPSSPHRHKPAVPSSRTQPEQRRKGNNAVMMIDLSPKKQGDTAPKRVFFGHAGVVDVVLRPSSSSTTTTAATSSSSDRCEISVDELKKRLSQLIGVSLGELDRLFDTSRCG